MNLLAFLQNLLVAAGIKNRRVAKRSSAFVVVTLLLTLQLALAEGTKQWSPSSSDFSFLKVNTTGQYAFAGYGVAANRRLYIRIQDAANERIYLGLSTMVNENTAADVATAYSFRIVSPTGTVVHGPFTVNGGLPPNLTSYAMSAAGPAPIVGAGGYPVTNPAWVFNPTVAGDYYLEFSTAASIKWFDITVATRSPTPTAINGRVWSQAWVVRANNGFTTLADAFDTPFNGAFFAYDGNYVTKINFQGAGLRPLEGQFSFNTNGTASTGNKESDRRSVQDVNAGNPQYQTFLNPPDPALYPVMPQGSLQNLPLKVTNPSTPNITVEVTQPGRVELLLDFGGDGSFTAGVDRRLFANVTAGTNTIPWNGQNGAGVVVGLSSYPIPVRIAYTQGETHFTAYDVEGLDTGFDVFTQTATGTIGPNLQFWDDVNIPDAPGTAPVVKTNVDTGAAKRQTWTNTDYGDLNTINTWWYAYRDYRTTTIVAPGDYGDAPTSYGVAWHDVTTSPALYLGGVAPDLENSNQPSSTALLDDNTGSDDEDSVATFPTLTTASGVTYTVSASVTNTTGSPAYLVGYIDFNRDGDFLDTGERSSTVTVNTSGSQSVSWTTPAGMTAGTTYARFRLSATQSQAESSVIVATSGEVEDYQITIFALAFGGGPGASCTAGRDMVTNGHFATLVAGTWPGWTTTGNWYTGSSSIAGNVHDQVAGTLTQSGIANWNKGTGSYASARIDLLMSWGNGVPEPSRVSTWDVEVAGVRYARMTTSNGAGTTATISYENGAIGNITSMAAGVNTNWNIELPSSVPATGNLTFRHTPTAPVGVAGDDFYLDQVVIRSCTDFGDAPDAAANTATGNYKTTDSDGGPYHLLTTGLSLGTNLDSEAGTLQNAAADADDTNGTPDDEDGVSSFPTLTTTSGATYTVSVNVTTSGTSYLRGFIDFNRDGDFGDSGEQSSTITVSASGSQSVSFTTPSGMTAGTTYARFRLSSTSGEVTSPTGAATSGEVEDYAISITASNIDLRITKASNLSGPQVGDTVIYTVTVENLSTTNATGVVVTDTFPADLTFNETVGCAEDPNVLAGLSITCSLGAVNAGTTKSFTVEGVVIDQGVIGDDSDDSGRVITNSVSVAANETDSDTSNNTDSVDITVSKLQLYKEVRNVTAGGAFTTSVSGKPGDILEYRINYTRTGPPIFDVLLEDALDANVTLEQNAYGSPADKEISLRCPDGTDVFLEAGAVTTLSINLVTACNLNTATDATSTVREALLNGETGHFLFRAKIR